MISPVHVPHVRDVARATSQKSARHLRGFTAKFLRCLDAIHARAPPSAAIASKSAKISVLSGTNSHRQMASKTGPAADAYERLASASATACARASALSSPALFASVILP